MKARTDCTPEFAKFPGVHGNSVQNMPIALTMGEPAGIAAEISLKAWLALRSTGQPFFLMHDPGSLSAAASLLRLAVPIQVIQRPSDAPAVFAHALPVFPIGLAAPVKPGVPDALNAPSVIEAIRTGAEFAASGQASALVTNPIQKSTLYAAGFAFPGHTEFLEHLAGKPFRSTMMLASPALRVVPVTVHQSLASAIADLTTESIVTTALASALALTRDFGIDQPRLAIAGLNPHAGEAGAMGREEIVVIEPAVRELAARGLQVTGPWPPDTLFTARSRLQYDAAICMYHDQALIPLKTLDVDGGVNVTLGLPFVRTSPDHGTALDRAGKGTADAGSLIAAIRLAFEISTHRTTTQKRLRS